MNRQFRKPKYINHSLIAITALAFFLSASSALANEFFEHSLTEQEEEWIDDHPRVTVAYDGFFPPYSFLNDRKKVEGFSKDVFDEISKITGITFRPYKKNTWKELYADAQAGQVDVVATMVQRDARREWFNFTAPYIEKTLVVITRDDNTSITSKDDLADKRIAAVKSYQYVKKVLDQYPKSQPIYVETLLDALNAVATGEADATITFIGAGHYYRAKYLLTNLKYAAVFDTKGSPESIAVRKDWPQLASILNKALNSIPTSKMQALREKWLPVDYLDTVSKLNLTPAEIEWIKNHRNLRLGVDPEFAPFEFIENGKYQGITSDYVRLLNQRLNMNMQVVKGLSWGEVIERAKQGEIDILPAVGFTKERTTYLNYSKPYLGFHRVIVARSNAPFITGLEAISKQRIAVQKNSSHHGFLTENYSQIKPVTFDTLQEAVLAVSDGRADAFVGNVAATTYWIRKLNLLNLKVAAPVSREVQRLHFAVRKDSPELVSILQKGLDSISATERKHISERWLTIEYDQPTDFTLARQLAVGFTLVLLWFVFWNYLLNRKVRKRTQELEYTAYYDALTGLPNRTKMESMLSASIEEAKKRGSKVALLSIDFDDFKKVNYNLGHEAGDELLQFFTNDFNNLLGEKDRLGRLGGDQFLMIQNDISDTNEITRKAAQIAKQTNRSYDIKGSKFHLSCSIGIAVFPDDGENSEELLMHADSATSHSKNNRQGSFAFFDQSAGKKATRHLHIEEQLRNALDKGELSVVYQPKVYAENSETCGFEALLRWNNAALGQLPPDEFIPIAEKTELINPIGYFVLDSALSFISKLNERFGTEHTMAVNISPIQLRELKLDKKIHQLLRQHQVDPMLLELEVTEGVLMGGHPEAEETLRRIKNLGVSLAMDDFGTGYSSIKNLKKYQFDTLKIDREFVTDLSISNSDHQLVSASIAMAHGFSMKVVAEGVETEAQSELLKNIHCDILQGWYFNKALTPENVFAMLEQQKKQSD